MQSVRGANTTGKLKRMIGSFGSLYAAANASYEELMAVIGPEGATNIVNTREMEGLEGAAATLSARKIGFTGIEDDDYPEKLKLIPDAPHGLYYLGKLPPDKPTVSIVGARNCSEYGRQMTREFSREIADSGISVISGMARGIDSIAERSTLDVDGYTCAVLGCGVDICYPAENRELYEDIKRRGCIISEYPPGTKPVAGFFPARNRIIAGLSDALLVMEAREKSGTLITVGLALEQGKDIYALPGRATDSLSLGCNQLIRDGAGILLRPELFVEEFLENSEYGINDTSVCNAIRNSVTKEELLCASLSPDELLIRNCLDYLPQSVSEIFFKVSSVSNMSLSELMRHLTTMTINKKINCIDGMNYSL
ncbi:DNA-protecting protein DprA [Lacrimispora saccharolytica]|nr:DNA-protecting protein DprA [Lacrimispora saccharolytica]